MGSPARDYLSRRTEDPYNPVLVEDLISGLNDWRSVQDIVRLTFKALSDVVKSQGSTLKELELQFASKASKSEFSQLLLKMRNYGEAVNSVNELKAAVESKMNIEDVYAIVEEKVSRNDLQYLLGSRAGFEELRNSLAEKADLKEIQSEIRDLKVVIEEMTQENYRKFQQCASKRDLMQVQNLVDTKAGKDEVAEALEDKANKQSVANALHRKANKADVENILNGKISEFEFSKVVETITEVQTQLSLKAEKNEIGKILSQEFLRKADYAEVEALQAAQKESEARISSFLTKVESFATSLKAKVDDMQGNLTVSLGKKCDLRELDRVLQCANRKIDGEHVKDLVSALQTEIKEQVHSLRYETVKSQDCLFEKYEKLEQNFKELQVDLLQAHESIRIITENSRISIEENMKTVQNYTGSKLEELKGFKYEIERIYQEIEDIKRSSTEKNELRKSFESKIDLKDVRDVVEKYCKDLARQLSLSNDELKDMILRKEKELIFLIEKKTEMNEMSSLVQENKGNRFSNQKINSSFRESRYVSYEPQSYYENYSKDLSRIRLELDERISIFITEQNALNEMLCAENCVARWIWRTGDVKNSFYIPWEIESVNTCPENFAWEVGSTSVITSASGLYELSYAIFSRKKPCVEVLVNGEPILVEFSCIGKNWGKHSEGNIISASAVEFITLPAKARISISYSGEPGAEGFLGLKKI